MGTVDITLNYPLLGPGLAPSPAPRRVEVVAGVDSPHALAGLPAEVAWVRTPCAHGAPAGLRRPPAGGLILGCPGRGDDSPARRERLLQSAEGYELVELDAQRDLTQDVLK